MKIKELASELSLTGKEVLEKAKQEKYGVGAFNCTSLESGMAIIAAAEELKSPVILQYADSHRHLISIDVIGPVMLQLAKAAKVPVVVHLDHGASIESCRHAVDMGFTSVMYDASAKPFEDNVQETRTVVEYAHKKGASVEAELGSMGRTETGSGEGTGANDETKIYTDPVLAKDFVAQTGIDALACSFGTTHGIYLTEPKLDFDVVKNVRTQTGNIPVVMHGGSGVSHDDYHTAIKSGVRKINYFTYMDVAGGSAVAEAVKAAAEGKPYFFTEMASKAREGMKQNVMAAMKMFALQE